MPLRAIYTGDFAAFFSFWEISERVDELWVIDLGYVISWQHPESSVLILIPQKKIIAPKIAAKIFSVNGLYKV